MANHTIPRQRSEKRTFWLDIIRGHSASGLSVEAWCRQNQMEMVQTCKRNGVEPWAYFKNLFEILPGLGKVPKPSWK